ncbi:VOC family protein [Rubripirellula amarantea]|uniref:Glyoxalase-like domain protein n=1 Tax=Rubripirellula amarantea TaxID=2527999 RepID=A0A5C5WI74_9BACT|nr:VOC family protein [Rubripirellula amarantea]MDA8743705.1 VOC family protein [Rubripirellula amarantea]TWT49761.1 Glyoxalase-like domain protein [Rubripirellula amarantea]
MNQNPVGWFEIYVHDLDRAKRFYETVFAVELNKMDSPVPDVELYGFPSDMNAGGAPGAIVKMSDCSPSGNGTIVYFSCNDCATEASRIESAGGKIQKPKTPIGQYGFMVLAIDTEGNVIGLHSMS